MLTMVERKAHEDTARNAGVPLDLSWVRRTRVNRSAVERRASTLVARRTVKKEWQAAWLLRAITCIDLTTLQGDDTPGNVTRLCAKGVHPLRDDMAEALGIQALNLHVAAICVYHNMVPVAVEALHGTDVPVAAVSTGFPAGQIALPQKLDEIAARPEVERLVVVTPPASSDLGGPDPQALQARVVTSRDAGTHSSSERTSAR